MNMTSLVSARRLLRRSCMVFTLLFGGLGVLLLSAVNTSQYPSHGQTRQVLLTSDNGRRSAATSHPTLDFTVRDQQTHQVLSISEQGRLSAATSLPTLDFTVRRQQSNPRQRFAGPKRHLVGLKEDVKEAKKISAHVRDGLNSVPLPNVPSSGNVLCPLHEPFLVYVYDSPSPGLEHPEVIESLIEHLQFGSSWTDDPESACVFVFVAGPWRVPVSSDELETMIHSLPHWERHGSRHVLVELSRSTSTSRALLQVRTGQALLATSYLPSDPTHMHNHVLASPLLAPLPNMYHPLPPVVSQLPWDKPSASLYFEGEMKNKYEVNITELCQQMQEYAQGPVCSIRCVLGRERGALGHEWSLCGDASYRYQMCKKARFALIPTGEMGPATYTRLLEALQCGAIPVFLGSGLLPFSEVIKWEKAALFLSHEMVPFVKYRLKIMNKKELNRYRLQGLFLYKTYFSSQLRIVESVVALIRHRLHHPPMWYPDYTPRAVVTTMPESLTHQYKMTFNYTEDVWNLPPGPFYAHTRPFQKHSLLSEMFSANADGVSTPDLRYVTDHPPTERYTVVVLTYHRDHALLNMLETFKGCPMLAKVVVVWNNEWSHADDLSWPDIGVPIEVVSMEQNSLNNRFLPLSNIETEAILSLDDDVCLTQEDIVLGFRVWQENRESIVGWMKRSHHLKYVGGGHWNFSYDTSHFVCDYSMVITNAAFFHKYYSYLYTYWVPESVREHVQRHMNCEDIAMNFLVSHITRQPPVLIGGMRTPECKSTKKEGLHNSTSHINARSHCLKDFERAYGYMPLLTSFFRARNTPTELRCSKRHLKDKLSQPLVRHTVNSNVFI